MINSAIDILNKYDFWSYFYLRKIYCVIMINCHIEIFKEEMVRKGSVGIYFHSNNLLDLQNKLMGWNIESRDFESLKSPPTTSLYLIEDSLDLREDICHFSKKFPTVVITKDESEEGYKQFLEGQVLDVLFYPFPLNLLRYKCEKLLSRLSSQFRICAREDMELVNMGLTFKQIQILRAIERSGKLGMSREELTSLIWSNHKVIPKALDVHLSGLRKKLIGSGQSIVFTSNRRWVLADQAC